MHRRVFDSLIAFTGFALAVVLLVAGALLTWAHVFVKDQVRSQLVSEKIFFPAAGTAALTTDPEIKKYVTPYAGQQVVNGEQAEVFADHYIAVHLRGIGGGKTYSELSAQSLADPTDTKLAATVQTMFRGETLRGLLLNAYAFGRMATIALYAAIAAYIGAALLLVLSALGFWHARKVGGVALVTSTPDGTPSVAAADSTGVA